MRRLRGRGAADRGSSTIELAVVSIPLLLLVGMVLAWGMAGAAETGVSTAARAAARAASQADSAGEAAERGHEAARRVLAEHQRECRDVEITVNVDGFGVPVGQPASVTATVACTVPLSEVAMPGLPGSRRLTADAISTLDQYAERGP